MVEDRDEGHQKTPVLAGRSILGAPVAFASLRLAAQGGIKPPLLCASRVAVAFWRRESRSSVRCELTVFFA